MADADLWLLHGEFVATIAFALSGCIAARQAGYDMLGICAVASLTAFGGGTVRDLILNRSPVWWIREDWPLLAVLTVGIFYAVIPILRRVEERHLVWPDAIGLGLFSVMGADIARSAGTPVVAAILLGAMSACLGGVLRDLACGHRPQIFHHTPLYGTCAILGGGLAILVQDRLPPALAIVLPAAVVVALRLLALRFTWRLPG
jgi:uncharacterized membrane protein YeiH